MFLRGPYSPQIHGIDVVEVLGPLLGGICRWDLDAGVVEGHVQATERRHGRIHHGGRLLLVRDVARHADCLVSFVAEGLGRLFCGLLIDISQNHGGPAASEESGRG